MRTILVPTDFSTTATNAVNYAAALARHINASVLLFHAYHVPIVVSEAPFVTVQEDLQMEEKSNEQLELIVSDIKNRYGEHLDIQYLSSPGLAADEIPYATKEKKCDLIIMGTHGLNGSAGILGSNTVKVIKHSSCDVLVIPEKATFQGIHKIVFAFDYMNVESNQVFSSLLQIIRRFDSEVLIFNMENSRIHPAVEKESLGILLEHIFENIKHTYSFSGQENIVEALNQFADINQAGMIAMIRRQHNLFQRLFKRGNTGEMVLHTHLPLLILHDTKTV
jgi:nucleotide-binding universal stress UspA family protein